MTEKYDNIINMPHHVSSTRAHMTIHDRAAQFSPFAALTGYDDAIIETARYTECKLELTDSEKLVINDKLIEIKNNIDNMPLVSLTYFKKDSKKAGGSYLELCSNASKIDTINNCIVFSDKTVIYFQDIYSIKDVSY